MNGTELTCNSSTNYAFKPWIDTMTSFSPDVKRDRLTQGGLYIFDPQEVVDFDAKTKKLLEVMIEFGTNCIEKSHQMEVVFVKLNFFVPVRAKAIATFTFQCI